MQTVHTALSRDIVEVGGPDRDAFLQGLISQDVGKVAPDRAAYGALLTPQGKYLHDFCMVEMDETIWLDCEGGRGGDLAKRLAIFKLRSRVTVSLREDLAVHAVFGTGAAGALGLAERAGAAASQNGVARFVDPRTAALGGRLIGPPEAVEAVLAGADLRQAPFADYDRARIALGVPDGTRDMEPEKSILLECNFEALNGIDWEKGCYMGQELTARTKYRGLVKRRLVALSVSGDTPAPGTPVEAGTRTIGEIRSARDGVALATVRVDALQHDAGAVIGRANSADLRMLTTRPV